MKKEDQKKEEKKTVVSLGIDFTKYVFIPGLPGLFQRKKKGR